MKQKIPEPQVRRSQIILFSLRLFFYLSILVLLAIHPAIAISFDRIGIVQWFVIIPLMAVFAFTPKNYWNKKPATYYLLPTTCLLLLSLIAGGFSLSALWPFLAGIISFVLTFLLFYYPRWGKLSLLEPFFLVWTCLRLLALSRSGEEIAGQSASLTQFILVWSAVVFLLHSVVVYFCLFPNSKRGAGKEGALFFVGAAAALILVLAVLPPDFIRNSIVKNINKDRAPQRIGEDSDRGLPREGGRQGRRQTGGNGRQPELRGMSEHNWQSDAGRSRGSDGAGESLQYLVKVVVSETEPVYMADNFKGRFDPIEGFLPSINEPLNELSKQRLFSTWRNSETNFDIDRTRLEILSLSTLQEKYLPYYPYSIDPTIINENAGPLRYIHQVVSDIHTDEPLMLILTPSRSLTSREENMLAQYMGASLEREDLQLFNDWLEKAKLQWQDNRKYFFDMSGTNEASDRYEASEPPDFFDESPEPINDYIENIFAILTAFSEYQYNLSYNEDVSIERIKEFLFENKDGDCVEFSNSAALLGRLAGIPSRVVTGYLAAEDLQTEAHLRGLVHLQKQIPFLQQFPFDNLFMVTNYHSHSWVQFYIPDYGWLDFETTQFAIPPLPSDDFNNFDVVIPVIEEKRVFSDLRKFPWRAVLRAAGWLAITALAIAYVLRYGREAVLFARSRRGGRDGARALYLLLLAKLAADGRPIKPASKTATEYKDLFLTQRTQSNAKELKIQQEHFKNFSLLYSELRWRVFEDQNETNGKYKLLKQEYKKIINLSKKKGIGWCLVRIVSLRGLAYL